MKNSKPKKLQRHVNVICDFNNDLSNNYTEPTIDTILTQTDPTNSTVTIVTTVIRM